MAIDFTRAAIDQETNEPAKVMRNELERELRAALLFDQVLRDVISATYAQPHARTAQHRDRIHQQVITVLQVDGGEKAGLP
jgi:hypothetical protein